MVSSIYLYPCGIHPTFSCKVQFTTGMVYKRYDTETHTKRKRNCYSGDANKVVGHGCTVATFSDYQGLKRQVKRAGLDLRPEVFTDQRLVLLALKQAILIRPVYGQSWLNS